MNDQIIATLAGLPVSAAFVYGSVARGTATTASDIDLFVILDRPLSDQRLSQLHARFADLQRRLGFTPDPVHPVEVFTRIQVHDALAAKTPDEDQQEIRRALADQKIIMLGDLEDLG